MRTNSGSWYMRRSCRNANGTYSGSRADWVAAYRLARVRAVLGLKPCEVGSSLEWKADLIVQYDRNSRDPILPTPATNRTLRHMIDEIMNEIREEENA